MIGPAVFAPITLRSGTVMAPGNDQFNDDEMWTLDLNGYCFTDLSLYPLQFRRHIERFARATDPQRTGAWSARAVKLYMEGLLHSAPEWMSFASGRSNSIRAPCSAYSAMAIAATIHKAAVHCDQYPSTRCYSTLGTRRAAHHQTFLEINAIYDELVRLWRLLR